MFCLRSGPLGIFVLFFVSIHFTLYKLCAVQRKVCSTIEGVQYGGGRSSLWVWVRSTDQSYHQYRGGISSVWTRVCSTDQSPSVRMRVCSTKLPKLYRGSLLVVFIRENDLLHTIPLLLRFYPTVIVSKS